MNSFCVATGWPLGTRMGGKREIQCYQGILAIHPDCATVHALIAFGYLSLGLDNAPKARRPALKAIDLDPSLAEGHLALADLKATYDRDFAGAEEEYRRTFALNPSYAQAYIDYSWL